MAETPDEFRLEDIIPRHHIGAEMFIPFTVLRLRGHSDICEAVWTISARDLGNASEQCRMLRVTWSPESVPIRPPGVSDHVVTEWAALGMACILVARYTPYHIFETAQIHDCFDFWLTDGHRKCGLEVSGTLSGALEVRHRAKIEQWRPNPHRVDGLVVVAGFDARQAILSFHRFPEGTQ